MVTSMDVNVKMMTSDERAALLAILDKFPRQTLVLLGDLVADEFVHGEIARVSREAPVLILKLCEKQILPGGGANAASNIASLGATVLPVGVVGDDEAGAGLLKCFRERGISTRHVLRLRNHLTPTKSRILGGLSHWQRQQIVRIDREPTQPPDAALRRRLRETVAGLLRKSSGLLVSDYGYGTTSAKEVAALRRKLRKELPMTVDSRFDLLTYSHVTAATPNEPEVEEALGIRIGAKRELLQEAGRTLLRRMALEALVITRGKDGMVLFEPRRAPQHIPVFGSDQALDVTGAGDTVIAAFSLALAAGATPLQAAHLANCAGGLVVMKRGTASVSRRELQEAIRNA
ncbi:MAG: sugar kinase [Acidobacteria bacterium]|nr:sugar kinase [Acidobacteriota bacterium]